MRSGWIPLVCTLALGAAAAEGIVGGVRVAQASPDWSVVFDGRIYDVRTLETTGGVYLSAQGLLDLLARVPGINVSLRADRGHIVISSGAQEGKPPKLVGFKGNQVVFVVGGTPITGTAVPEVGVPFVSPDTFRSVLEALDFTVNMVPDSGLMSVARLPGGAAAGGGSTAGGGQAPTPSGTLPPAIGSSQAPAMPMSAGMSPQQMQAAADQMLRSMGVDPAAAGALMGAPPSSGVAAAGGNAAVCSAMDQLRASWHATEPSAQEKAAFQEVARRLQAARDQGGTLDPKDVEILSANLKTFRAKVDRRRASTAAWAPPDEATRVKTLGVQFLDTYTQAMQLSQDMMAAIEKGDKSFVQRGEEDIKRLQELNNVIQQQGMAFDQEVTRVRGGYGCGPATVAAPPS